MNSNKVVGTEIAYPLTSMVEMVYESKRLHPEKIAYDFMGKSATYTEFIEQIETAARALMALGAKKGDRITICMPNVPQALVLLYAVNRIGAVASMVHPLSAENEILFYLNQTESRIALTLSGFYEKFENIRGKTMLETVIVANIAEALPVAKKMAYKVISKERKVSTKPGVITYQDFTKKGEKWDYPLPKFGHGEDVAVILFSGGTTGTPKGILLSNFNFNAVALQTKKASGCVEPGARMLSIMPIFHGFGLAIGIHSMLIDGAMCALIPQIDIKKFPGYFKKYRPSFVIGVPTLFEAIMRCEGMKDVDLSSLTGICSGGDMLSMELKKKVDTFLKEHGANVELRQGYGMTECVAASCITPVDDYRDGSIGLPFPDTYYKIVEPETNDEVATGELGEICISGPSVMMGYLNCEKETAKTLRIHEDGRIWLHTGDLGYVDADGHAYFRQRLKRMIVTNGYNVYPSQVEGVIDAHEAVLSSTVIGVKDDYRMQRVKAFIILKPGIAPTDEVRDSIKAHCERNIARYALPKEYEFRDSLPKTLVGKIAYRVLEEEEMAKNS